MRRVGAARLESAAALARVDPKFHAGPNELEQERTLKVLQPRNAEQHQQMVAMVKLLRQHYSTDASMQNALALWQGQLLTGMLEDDQKFQFVRRFYWWLLGRGTADDHRKTFWNRGNAAVINREVALYIEQFAQRRLDYALQLSLLANRVPDSLTGYWLYFKYIVGGELKRVEKNGVSWWDLTDDNYLADFEMFFQYFGGVTGYGPLIKGAQGNPPFDASRPYPSNAAQMAQHTIDDAGTQANMVQTATQAAAPIATLHVRQPAAEYVDPAVQNAAVQGGDANVVLPDVPSAAGDPRIVRLKEEQRLLEEANANEDLKRLEALPEVGQLSEEEKLRRAAKGRQDEYVFKLFKRLDELAVARHAELYTKLGAAFASNTDQIAALAQQVTSEALRGSVDKQQFDAIRAQLDALQAKLPPTPTAALHELKIARETFETLAKQLPQALDDAMRRVSSVQQTVTSESLAEIELMRARVQHTQREAARMRQEDTANIASLQAKIAAYEAEHTARQETEGASALQVAKLRATVASLEHDIGTLKAEHVAEKAAVDDMLLQARDEYAKLRKRQVETQHAHESMVQQLQAERDAALARVRDDRALINEMQADLRRPPPVVVSEEVEPVPAAEPATNPRKHKFAESAEDDIRYAQWQYWGLMKLYNGDEYGADSDKTILSERLAAMPDDAQRRDYMAHMLQQIKQHLNLPADTTIDRHGKLHDAKGRFVRSRKDE